MNKITILIIEDNPISCKVISATLESEGYTVVAAIDGASALKAARTQKFDLIIQDLFLPDIDGVSLNQQLRELPNVRDLPIFALSGFLAELDIHRKHTGFTTVLLKPILPSHLLNIVQAYLPSTMNTSSSNRQLERQASSQTKLSQRCAKLMSQLSLIGRVVNTITGCGKDVDEFKSLKEGLYFSLDAMGIEKGALFIKQSNGTMLLREAIGFTDGPNEKLASLFGVMNLFSKMTKMEQPILIPSEHFFGKNATHFLTEARVKFALVVPLFSGGECLGMILLGADSTDFSKDDTREFIHTLGLQFGQSIALTSAFDQLRFSEKKYRQLVEISPNAVFLQQGEVFVYANKAALNLLGANQLDQLLDRSFYDFISPNYHKDIKQYMQKNKDITSKHTSEVKLINLKGETLDVEMVMSPFLYQEKDAMYMFMRDITEGKQSSVHLEVQYAIAWTLAESSTLFVATGKILKIICERLQWDCGVIWAVDKEANILRCMRVLVMPQIQNDIFHQACQNLTFVPGAELPGKIWIENKAIWKSDISQEDNVFRHASFVKLGLRAEIAFPIIYEQEVLGVIEFFSKKSLQHNHSALLWFESIGRQLGVFLKRKHMEKQMLYLSEHDVLTGLSNRKFLEQYLGATLIKAEQNNFKIAVLFLDLDHFKYVNDSIGHLAGDLLLKEVSKRLSNCLRQEDMISRLGGDEFIILLSNISQENEIIEIIGKLQNELSNQSAFKEKSFFMTVSIGISVYPDNGDTVQALIKGADIAMYAAKEKGRNTFQFCTSEMTVKAENRGFLINNLRTALDKDEFILYYQPKIDIVARKIIGMEALIRWKRSNVILLPDSFIAVAEDSDLIIPISEWVIKTACLQNKTWQTAGLPTLDLSVNISVRCLNDRLLQCMEEVLAETKLDPHSFEIELTESALMYNVEYNIQILQSLKEMGLKISIDDFGTGYSSLSYLKRFPIDVIKIDRSFVHNIATDPNDAAIVTAIIAMAHSLSFKVIAEGVENEAQLKFLKEHGCEQIQGFYFSRPMPAEEATQFIIKGSP